MSLASGGNGPPARALRSLRDRWEGAPLATKLSVLGTSLIVVLIATVLIAVSIEMRASTKELLVDALGRSQAALVAREQEELHRLLWASSLITQNPTLRAAIETYRLESAEGGSREDLLATIDNEVGKIAAGLDKDLLLITDEAGVVLAARESGGLRPLPGEDLSGIPILRQLADADAAPGPGGFSVMHLGGQAFLAGSVPIELQGFPIGTLTLADRVDAQFLQALRGAHGGEIVVAVGGRVLESTLPGVTPGDRIPVEDVASGNPSRPQLALLGGEEYVFAILPLGRTEAGQPVSVYLLRSLSQVLRQPQATLLRTLAMHGAAAVLLGMALTWWLSRSMLRRLARFMGFMRSVAETGDYTRRFSETTPAVDGKTRTRSRHSRNELSLLTGTFDEMLSEIQGRDQELRRQIHERLQAEEALSEKEDQLRQSQKMEAMGRLAGGVAHDFNNLLTIIGGYSQMLLLGLDDNDPRRGKLQEIHKASDRAASLTQQLLAFSRKQVRAPRVLNLNHVVANVEKMLRRLIGEDIHLHTELTPDLRNVQADPGQVEQILLNLAVNARDAMTGGGSLTIATRNLEVGGEAAPFPGMPTGAYVRLTVRDTGCGMDERTRLRIFEPFFTTKETGKGTGLGMSMVYGIVKQSGGWILVDSAPGRGTAIDVYLPRVEQSADEADAEAPAAVPRGSETLLLVEDEDPVRAFARTILEGNGYRVLEARHGLEAVTVGRGHEGPIHLMVTDVVMPHLNGREAYERLCELRPALRVLYTSGYPDRALVGEQGALQPNTRFLPKPFTPADLAAKVREVLDASGD